MNSSVLLGTAAVPLITAIIQVAKSAGLPKNLSPALALALGLAAGLLAVWQIARTGQPPAWADGVVLGIAWGLAAAGLYAAGKHTVRLAARVKTSS